MTPEDREYILSALKGAVIGLSIVAVAVILLMVVTW